MGQAGPALEMCALITTGPNTFMEPIQNRIGVLLPESAYVGWINSELQNPLFCMWVPGAVWSQGYGRLSGKPNGQESSE